MRQRRTLILLALVFSGLILWSIFGRISPSAAPLPNPTAAVLDRRVYNNLSLPQVTAIRLRSPETGAAFAIARDLTGAWQVIEGNGTTITPEAGDALALTVVVLPYIDILAPSDDLTEYGFAPEGIISVEVLLSDGSSSAVAIGVRTPTESGYYALIDARPDLYILDRAPVDYLISLLRDPPIA